MLDKLTDYAVNLFQSLICMSVKLIFLVAAPLIVWSEDDWLKKFSGKTIEESEEAESAAESASTNTQEVGML